MEVSNLNQVNNLSQNQSLNTTSGIHSKKTIEYDEKDALELSIDDSLRSDRNSLSFTLESLNDGIATSQIAQNALQKQEDILANINQIFNGQDFSNLNETSQNELKKDIILSLQSFNEIANNTSYNNQTLLNQNENYLNISTQNASFSIELPNSLTISDELITQFRQTDLSNPDSLDALSEQFKQSELQIQNNVKELQNVQNRFQEVAKDNIQEQIEISNSYSTNNIDFGREVVDFTKNSVTSQLGYLVSSQANTNQTQSVRLLS